ncbi:MAG: mechanosensitive ion channel, partial [Phycisphaeraceae bacterium]|nr:mechanosensitive ion channel [Phycisphaeraceae bacterium]
RMDTHTAEISWYDASLDLLAVQRDLATQGLAHAEKQVQGLQITLDKLRQAEAAQLQQAAQQASKQANWSHPLIQAAARTNAELAEIQTNLTNRIEQSAKAARLMTERLTNRQSDFARVQESVLKAEGMTHVLGIALLSKRNDLPDLTHAQRSIKARPTESAQVQLEWVRYDQRWSQMADILVLVQNAINTAEPPIPEQQEALLSNELTSLLQTQRQTIKRIADLYLNLTGQLASLDANERSLVKTVNAYSHFINEHILWIQSSPTLGFDDLGQCKQSLSWLLNWHNWSLAWINLGQDAGRYPGLYGFMLLLICVTLALRRWSSSTTAKLTEKTRHLYSDQFIHTLEVFPLTLFPAITGTLVVLLLAWRWNQGHWSHEFNHALGSSLYQLWPLLLTLLLAGRALQPAGLANHLGMTDENSRYLHQQTRRFLGLTIPLTFISLMVSQQPSNELLSGGLGRLAFIVTLLVLAFFLGRVLRPKGPLLLPFLASRRGGWLDRLRYLWYGACIATPIGLIAMTLLGYTYGARHLYLRLLWTLLLLISWRLVDALLVRWLEVIQKRSVIRARRKTKPTEQATPSASPVTTSEEPTEIQLISLSTQTRRLISALATVLLLLGFWGIWRDVFPALGMLENIHLYNTSTARGDEISIGLGALFFATALAIMTTIIVRNVPGLLEIIVLQHLPLDRGARFAITTLCRYGLAIIGIIMMCSSLGLSWNKVQWLVAGMTLGLGFGLQEIFANFISGLIILFEQPVRVDDVVTVGDVSGTVTKIRIRATTIRKWDERELIVPNKEFITGRLVNWTLSDNTMRMNFVVGIAYGSDTAKTEKLLYKVAQDEVLALEDPAPVVIFRAFGDSSLEFELRIYFSGIDSYCVVWHQINMAIDNAFRKAGIEIAFPQRDLHLRSSEPIISVLQEKAKADTIADLPNID